ncbi:hypothetical protein SDC9_188256 [bioreactor metagenome]|uniref:BIG2 domain-containing protein n=1 Tax=bioreactor metagenome TaxID=1076179 RepID=A0A645HP38_9ZZZZ|nr:hypothetical protein [Cloacibacillus evryensis]MEA5034230.1 hypothetical protein [Cloacibacillus evryensis]
MKSIEMTEESYKGIPADVEAFTAADEEQWFKSQDISCAPAILSAMKGLRAMIAVTALALTDEAGDAVASATELSIAAGDSLRVKVARTPVYSGYPITWTSEDATKVKVTADPYDSAYALIEPVAANASAVTITATGSVGITATCTIKPVV